MTQLNNFYNFASKRGFSKDYLGRVSYYNFPGSTLGQKQLLYVKSFTLPGADINETSLPFQGRPFKISGPVVYNQKNIDITFYSDEVYAIRRFFENQLQNQPTDRLPLNELNLTLTILQEDHTPGFEINLFGAYIKNIGTVTYDIAGTGNVQLLTVSYSYNEHTWIDFDPYDIVETNPWVVNSSKNNINSVQTGGSNRTSGDPIAGESLDAPKPFLGGLIAGLNSIARTAQAIGSTASTVRSAGRAIRGR